MCRKIGETITIRPGTGEQLTEVNDNIQSLLNAWFQTSVYSFLSYPECCPLSLHLTNLLFGECSCEPSQHSSTVFPPLFPRTECHFFRMLLPLKENLCVNLPSPKHAIGSLLDPHLWPSISSLRFVPCRTVQKWSPKDTYKNSVGRAICNISIWRLPKGSPIIEWMRIILIHSHIVLQ